MSCGGLHSVEPEAHFYDRKGRVWYVDETPGGNIVVWSPETRPPFAPLHVRWAIEVVDGAPSPQTPDPGDRT